MPTHRIDHPHDEASALAACHNRVLLDAYGFDRAFWVVSDEAQAHTCLALLGRQGLEAEREDGDSDGSPGEPGSAGDTSWMVVKVKAKRSKGSTKAETDDPECIARAGAWIYVMGSHFGSKTGPLDPTRHFIARFNESKVKVRREKVKLHLDVCREPYVLHRLVNDALKHRGVELIPIGDGLLDSHIRATLDDDDQAEWTERVHHGDRPINIEGCSFLPNGRLLLGLRYPVTSDGNPIAVEVDGIDRLFDPKGTRKYGPLQVTRVFVLQDVGSRACPAGVRAMDARGSTVHVVTGDLDSDPDESQVLATHPEGQDAANEHRTFEVPYSEDHGVVCIQSTCHRRFDDEANVEGIALFEDGSIWYAHDDDVILLDEVLAS